MAISAGDEDLVFKNTEDVELLEKAGKLSELLDDMIPDDDFGDNFPDRMAVVENFIVILMMRECEEDWHSLVSTLQCHIALKLRHIVESEALETDEDDEEVTNVS